MTENLTNALAKAVACIDANTTLISGLTKRLAVLEARVEEVEDINGASIPEMKFVIRPPMYGCELPVLLDEDGNHVAEIPNQPNDPHHVKRTALVELFAGAPNREADGFVMRQKASRLRAEIAQLRKDHAGEIDDMRAENRRLRSALAHENTKGENGDAETG